MDKMNLCFFVVISFQYSITSIFATPPKLIPLIDHIDVLEKSTVPLICSLLVGSDINFEWTLNDLKLTNNSNTLIENSPKYSLLTLQNVQKIHGGVYKCRASNSFKEFDVTKTQINIKGI